MKFADIVKDGKTEYAYSRSRDWAENGDISRLVVISDQRFSRHDSWLRNDKRYETTMGPRTVPNGYADPTGRALLAWKFPAENNPRDRARATLVSTNQIIGPWQEVVAEVERVRRARDEANNARLLAAQSRSGRWAALDSSAPGIIPAYNTRSGATSITLKLEELEELLRRFGVEVP